MKQIILGVFFTLLIFSSCNKDEQIKTFVLEQKFQIDQSFASTNNPLKFTITEINDSRCPSDVVCVWEGKADVTIKVESPVSGIITLSTYDHLIDTVGNYSFELIDVSPAPISTETIELEDYKVNLKIKEL